MLSRPLIVFVALFMTTTALAGCFGTDAAVTRIDGSALRPFEANLFLSPVMFHPYPGGMLTAWVFGETPDQSTFDIPVFRVTEGQTVRFTFTNTFDFNHTIHWHGLDVPWAMDGVPYLTQDPVLPGESFTYEFEATPAGTHFFHCHVDTQHHLDMGMYGVLIVEPAEADPYPYDSEELVVLDDWDSSHLHQSGAGTGDPEMTANSAVDPSGDPIAQFERTQNQVQDTYNNPQYPVVKDVYQNPARAQRDWYPETFAPWNPDYDVFTINGKSYPWTDPIPIKAGEVKKLRLVNVGNSAFVMHLHGHHFEVTHKDGFPLAFPIKADTWPIHPGERYDLQINAWPAEDTARHGIWPFHSHVGGQSANNHISPGGALTHLVYEGFDPLGGGGHDHSEIRAMNAGDFLGLYK